MAFSLRTLQGLMQRELAEHRRTMLLVPLVLAAVQLVLMLIGLVGTGQLLSDGVNKLDDWAANSGAEVNVVVTVNEPLDPGGTGVAPLKPLPGAIGPAPGTPPAGTPAVVTAALEQVLLPLSHRIFMLALMLVSALYLLGALYNDRRDRSVLFFKSMPVAEAQEIASKLLLALLLAPAIYLAASWLTQSLMWVLLQISSEPAAAQETVGFSLLGTLIRQGAALLLGLAWAIPVYCWLLLASAAANRSPAVLAILLPLGLGIGERVVAGSNYLGGFLQLYLPRLTPLEEAAASPGMLWLPAGWLMAGVFLLVTNWLRRFRFEL